MSLIKWEPLEEIDRLFNEPLFNFTSLPRYMSSDLATDIYEDDGTVYVKISMPGMQAADIDISINENLLTIHGTRQEESERDHKDYHTKEIRRGAFSRVVSLPASVVANRATAEMKDGMLTISAPIQEDSKDKMVQVKIK